MALEGAGSYDALRVTVDLAGQPVDVLALHLRWPVTPGNAAAREVALARLAKLARQAPRPLVLVGDFDPAEVEPADAAEWTAAAADHALRLRARLEPLLDRAFRSLQSTSVYAGLLASLDLARRQAAGHEVLGVVAEILVLVVVVALGRDDADHGQGTGRIARTQHRAGDLVTGDELLAQHVAVQGSGGLEGAGHVGRVRHLGQTQR